MSGNCILNPNGEERILLGPFRRNIEELAYSLFILDEIGEFVSDFDSRFFGTLHIRFCSDILRAL